MIWLAIGGAVVCVVLALAIVSYRSYHAGYNDGYDTAHADWRR